MIMHVHEYQAKAILKEYGILSPTFDVASSLEEACEVLSTFKFQNAVIKAQIHAGARGKVGGILFAKNRGEILRAVDCLLGKRFVNEQTGPYGLSAHRVMITAAVDIEKEYYVGALIDRKNATSLLVLSKEGGSDIEELAKTQPEKILKLPIDLKGNFDSEKAASFMEFDGIGKSLLISFAKAFVEKDALLFEINPLVLTKDHQLLALDAKLTVDDNALFRHKDIQSFFDPTQLTASEVQAKQYDLSYLPFDGDIGCMVNGAGLAMATMDLVEYYGGSPANFLDVGGGATKEKIAQGIKILLDEKEVKAILVNIFGGIMNCVTIAEGILDVSKEIISKKIPIIVRMEGTNVEKARYLLQQSKLDIKLADDLEDAAKKVVIAAGIV